MKSLALLLALGVAPVAFAQEEPVPELAAPKSAFSGAEEAAPKPRALKVITAKDRQAALELEQARQKEEAATKVSREMLRRKEKEVAELEAVAVQAEEQRSRWLEEEKTRDAEAARLVKLPKAALAAPEPPEQPAKPPIRKVLVPGAASGG